MCRASGAATRQRGLQTASRPAGHARALLQHLSVGGCVDWVLEAGRPGATWRRCGGNAGATRGRRGGDAGAHEHVEGERGDKGEGVVGGEEVGLAVDESSVILRTSPLHPC